MNTEFITNAFCINKDNPEVPLMMEHLQTAEEYKAGAEYIWKVEEEIS
jgi:hypothetical protein